MLQEYNNRITRLGCLLTTCLVGLLWVQTLIAQSPFSFAITQKNGLSNNSVTGMVKDSRGFLWIATRDGLNRYDGYSVKIFTVRDQFLALEGDNMFESLCTNGGDSLFLSVGKTVLIFNTITGEFHEVPVQFPVGEYSDLAVLTLQPDGNRGLWIGYRQAGLVYFSFREGTTSFFIQEDFWKEKAISSHISAALPDTMGGLWLGTLGGGLMYFHSEKRMLEVFSWNPLVKKFSYHQSVRSLAFRSKKDLWVGTWGYGLKTFDRTTKAFHHIWDYPNPPEKFPYNDIRFIYPESSGEVWFGTNGGGLFQLDKAGNVKYHFSKQGKGKDFIADNDAHDLFKEQEGVYWVATDGAGLQTVNLNLRKFLNVTDDSDSELRLTNTDVHEIMYDSKGNLWVGTNGGGINMFKPGIRAPVVYESEFGNERKLLDNTVYSLSEDNLGNIWIGTNSGGLQVLNPKTSEFKNLKSKTGERIELVYSTFFDSQQNLWVSTYHENFYYPAGSDKMNLANRDSLLLEPLKTTFIQAFTEDSEGTVWIGTNSLGVWIVTPEKKKLVSLESRLNSAFPVLPRNVSGLALGRNGTIWIATAGSGLFSYNGKTHHLNHFTTSDGLIHDNLMGIVGLPDGTVWVSSPIGLTRVVPMDSGEPEFFKFDSKDGISNEMFNRFAAGVSPDGHVVFGGTGGLTIFDPTVITGNPDNNPEVFISSIRINNEIYSGIPEKQRPLFPAIQSIDLQADDFLTLIEVVSPVFTSSSKIRYSYRIPELNSVWSDLGTNRTISLMALPPGKYILEVRSSDSNGNWNKPGLVIPVTVHPNWWATWWARVSFSLIFAGLLTVLITSRIRRTVADKKRLEKQVTERTRELEIASGDLRKANLLLAEKTDQLQTLINKKTDFFTNVAHEFRTPLTLILGPMEKWGNSRKDPETEMMIRNARRMKRLIDQLLALAKADSGDLVFQPAVLNFTAFIREITQEFKDLALTKKRVVQFSAPGEDIWFAFDHDQMEKILTNLLSNAFKFTGEGDEIRVDIRFGSRTESGSPTVLLSVEDSGIGIPTEKQPFLFDRFYQVESGLSRSFEGSGIGLALVKELVELHRGTIQVFSYPLAGSRFTITFPVEEISGVLENRSDKLQLTPGIIEKEIPELLGTGTASPEGSSTSNDPASDVSILIAEDNKDLQNYLKEMLGVYQIQVADNGQIALKKANETVPDLLITDVMMPEMNGYDLVRSLKTNLVTSHIPVIMLTAKSSLDSKLAGLELGADAYLGKPFNEEELRAVIGSLLSNRNRIRQYYRASLSEQETPGAENEKPTLPERDQQFLETIKKFISDHVSDPELSVDQVAAAVFLSKSQLNRKLSALTGQSIIQHIRSFRINQARSLLLEGSLSISEIAWQVGMPNLAYFSKVFREVTGKTPSEFR